MIAAELRIEQSEPLRLAFERAPELAERHLADAVTSASFFLWREVAERTPTSGAGTLRQSIRPRDVRIVNGTVEGGVATSLAYALPVELGTRPHMPPVRPIAEWVGRKLGISGPQRQEVAWRIARAIAKRGTEGAFMFARAFDEERDGVASILRTAAARIADELDGGTP